MNHEDMLKMKEDTKKYIDCIGTETEEEQKVIKLIYGFTYTGYRECMISKQFKND